MNKQVLNLPHPDRPVSDVPDDAYRGISSADRHYRLSCEEVQWYIFDEFTYLLEGAMIYFWCSYIWGHQQLSRKSEENKSFKSNQLAPSIYIMIELCFLSLDQWEIKVHLLWGKSFNTPHWPRNHSTNGRFQQIEELSKFKTSWPSFRPNQT